MIDKNKELVSDAGSAGKVFSLWKVLLPVAIGLAAVAWMFWRDAKSQNIGAELSQIDFSASVICCIALAWLFMIGRDFGLCWRFRVLTDGDLSWKQAMRVTCLCEFTSAVTPTAVGGSSLGMLFLNRENIELGRATTLMLATLFLDELFFVVACPIIVLFTPLRELFATGGGFGAGLEVTFWLIYSGIFLWTLFLFLGIIVWPGGIRRLLVRLFSISWLRRWQPRVVAMGANMQATSTSLRSKSFKFWIQVFCGTSLSWISRFLVVNALFLAFVPSADACQWLIFARQTAVWVVLMVSPTPGGAGLSEWLFSEFYDTLIPTAALSLVMAISWRIVSYYIYLLIGAVLVPKWLRDSFGGRKKSKL